MNNRLILRTSLFVLLLLLPAAAPAASEPMEIPLWPNGAPGSEGKNDKEIVNGEAAWTGPEHTLAFRVSAVGGNYL